jgi:GntR family transcriptional regulator
MIMQDLQPCRKQQAASRTPKYVAIRRWLSSRIAAGTFARGEQLPSEHELMAQFGCSRVTVRQALDDLRRVGAIEAQRGRGSFVSRLTAVHNLQRLQSFGEIMAPLGVETRSDVLNVIEKPASREVAAALALDSGETVTRIERLRIAGGAILSFDVSFFPLDVGQRLTKLDLEKEDIFVLLESRLDTELGFADLTIDVVPASDYQAGLIGVKPKEQVLRIRRLTHDSTGRGIDYERIYARLDAMQFRARLGRW